MSFCWITKIDLCYGKKISAEEFIGHVWYGIKQSDNHEHVVEKATKVFLEPWVQGNRTPVGWKDIIAKPEFKKYRNSNSHGLWPWLKKNGNAGVIEQSENDVGKTVEA